MKKPSVLSFLITLLLAAAVCAQEPVKDTEENPIIVGEQYFIQPAKINGGGLVPAAINIFPLCPLGITGSLPLQPGLPVRFTYKFLTMDKIVNTTLDVNIRFISDIWPFCNEFSKLWEVDDSSPASKEPPILIGGKRESRNSSFIIEKAGEGANTYKLTSLNGIVGSKPGLFGTPQLVLTNDNAKTYFVKFKKVDDTTTATDSTSRVEKLGLRMFPFY